MLRQHAAKLKYIALALDVLTTVVSFAATFFLRDRILAWWHFGQPLRPGNFSTLLVLIVLVWTPLLHYHYKDLFRRFTSFATEMRISLHVVTVGFLLVLTVAYLLGISIPRSLLLMFALVNIICLLVEKTAVAILLRFCIARGYNNKALLIVGAGDHGRDLARKIRRNSQWGLLIQGFVDKNTDLVGTTVEGIAVLGTPDSLADLLHQHAIQEVIFTVPLRNLEEVHTMLRLCEEEGVSAHVVSDFFRTHVSKIHTDRIYGVPILSFVTSPREDWQLAAKRMADLAVSAVLLIVLLPFLAVIALLIKLTSPGPVLYPWRVVGQNKKPFTGYKFRTMVVDADQIKEQLMANNEMNGPAFKMKEDPRVTRVGRWLRKYSLDELPQLWSVLKGDMSLVGPRPPLQSELPRFESWHRRKLSVKPGLICLREVNGRSDIKNFDDWVRLDLAYVDNWSFWLDAKILLKVIPVVVMGRGAY